MKKFWILPAAIGLIAAMSSCSKNEIVRPETDVDPSAINFNSFTGKQTKADDATLQTLQGDASGFKVYATWGTDLSTFQINGDSYAYTGGKWGWTGQITHKWSDITGYPARFYATHPSQDLTMGTTTSPTTIENVPQFSYTVISGDEDASEQKDLLGALNQQNTAPSSGIIPFGFQHLLSKIDFKVKTTNSIKVYIKSIKICNAGKTATYSFKTSGTDVVGMWSTPTEVNESFGYLPMAEPKNFSGNATAVNPEGKALMMMPQTLTKWVTPYPYDPDDNWTKHPDILKSKSYIEVVYRMVENNAGTEGRDIVGYTHIYNNDDHIDEGPLFVKVAYPLEATWEPGKEYTYTLIWGTNSSSGGNNIDEHFIKDDGTTSTVTVVDPQTGTEIVGGQPIFGTHESIDFNVTVSDWVTGTDTDIEK